MSQVPIDYAALAQQHGAISSQPPPSGQSGQSGQVDYAALAKQYGAVSSQPAAAPEWRGGYTGAYDALGNKISHITTNFREGFGLPEHPIDQFAAETKQLFTHPVESMKSIVMAPVQGMAGSAQTELQRAKESFNKASITKPSTYGAYLDTLAHGIYSAIPLAGSKLGEAGEQANQGDFSGATAKTAGVIAPFAAASPEMRAVVTKPITTAVKAGAQAIVKPVAPLLPKIAVIEGVEMPVLVGESEPLSTAGRLQTGLKYQGIRSGKFQEIAIKQQAATKQVIANVAAKTADMTDLSPTAEPGPAMAAASDATFAKARPMYQALDASLTTVPDTMSNVSAIVKQAQARAAKLGATFADTSEEATYQKAVADYKLEGEAAAKLRTSMGLPEEGAGAGQPLQAYLKTRSELLKMARSTSDRAVQRAIGQELDSMNAAVETALKSSKVPGLYDNWQAANRLWTKGYALERVSDALNRAVRGTPVEQQISGIQPQPPRIAGARLVQELNKLDDRGDLSRAFTPAQQTALRNVADLLDRSQRTRIGQISLVKGGYSPHSMAWHTITDVIKSVGSAPFVKIMTSERGAIFMNRMINAQTPAAAAVASTSLKNFVTLGPGAEGLSGTTRTINQAGKPLGTITYQVSGDTATIHHFGGPETDYNVLSNQLGRSGLEDITAQIKEDNPGVKYVQGIRVGGARGDAGRSVRIDVSRVASPAARQENAFYTQARQELGSDASPESVQARAQQLKQAGVQVPSPPPSIVHRAATSAHPLTSAQRSAAVGAIMSQLKSGELSQQDADRQIQRINGGGGRKLIRMPAPP